LLKLHKQLGYTSYTLNRTARLSKWQWQLPLITHTYTCAWLRAVVTSSLHTVYSMQWTRLLHHAPPIRLRYIDTIQLYQFDLRMTGW